MATIHAQRREPTELLEGNNATASDTPVSIPNEPGLWLHMDKLLRPQRRQVEAPVAKRSSNFVGAQSEVVSSGLARVNGTPPTFQRRTDNTNARQRLDWPDALVEAFPVDITGKMVRRRQARGSVPDVRWTCF